MVSSRLTLSDQPIEQAPPIPSLMFHPGWVEFNKRKWDLTADVIDFPCPGSTEIIGKAVLYLDRHGHWCQPPIDSYVPVWFASPDSDCLPKHRSLSPLTLRKYFADFMEVIREHLSRHALNRSVALPPEILDVRPFQWAGYSAEVRYTYYLDYPLQLDNTDREVRRKIRHAEKLGCRVERTTNFAHVVDCFSHTQSRQGIELRISADDLNLARSLVGDDCFRCYIAYDATGRPARANVVLAYPATRALMWMCGTNVACGNGMTEAVALLQHRDLEAGGCPGVDMCGANINSIAYLKGQWGGRLVPYYAVEHWLWPSILHAKLVMLDHAKRLRRIRRFLPLLSTSKS